MMRTQDSMPSKNITDYWIYALGVGEGCYETGQTYVGKWLIFVSSENVDEVWERIRQGTESGELGISAKVSTKHQISPKYSRYVICVYTNDFRDETNIGEVLKSLRQLGITGKLYYKTDQATLSGIYSRDGPLTKKKGRASLYTSDDFETHT